MSPVSLDSAPLNTPMTLVAAGGPLEVRRRLSSLGLRPGVTVSLLHRTSGGGRIVSVGIGRVAVAREVLASLLGEVVS